MKSNTDAKFKAAEHAVNYALEMDPELQAELIVEHGLDNFANIGGKEA
jgi:hypothetical protein